MFLRHVFTRSLSSRPVCPTDFHVLKRSGMPLERFVFSRLSPSHMDPEIDRKVISSSRDKSILESLMTDADREILVRGLPVTDQPSFVRYMRKINPKLIAGTVSQLN